ncbi:MAG: 1-(5-phosphoribosyl)-5-[(5-phosphoribosylamino)methylideneamino]imidazole-4-carboxamide isomerase [Trueperaceae bacterium]|nr:1-(5-phosphoribosyl)-5-[(5-phosphoribosylamino)methylideneamino]imidazole-4-carboxamide isomerase [Trueperaceae bacterium]
MFEIIPAVDVQDGRAVRLFEGDPDRETVYFETPLEAARHWAELGARTLHLVDLDAALGRGDNRAAIERIARELPLRTEVGGGVRSEEAARGWLEVVDRVVLGTVAVERPDVVDALLLAFGPSRVVVSVDAKDGRVAVRGWREVTELSAVELAERVARQGVRELIYTDVGRDGTMRGVDAEPVARLRDAFPHRLVAGGGVARDEDLDTYERLGLDGAIVGRALYEGTVRYPRTA